MIKLTLISLLTASAMFAGDFSVGGYVGLKAPQKELKELSGSNPGTSVGGYVSESISPCQTLRFEGGYDFYPQYTLTHANYYTVSKVGSWTANLDYLYSVTPHFYAFVGGGMKRWTQDYQTTYTHDMFFYGTRRTIYTANKPFAHAGIGVTIKHGALEVGYTEGKISQTQKAQSIDGTFIVKF